jgi:DNA-binding MarR family transcriptional regulator
MSYDELQDLTKMHGGKNIVVPSCLFTYTHNYSYAVILAQMIWWNNLGHNKYGWFYKSAKEWKDEIGIDYKTVQRATRIFEKAGFLKTQIHVVKGKNRTVHYKVDLLLLSRNIRKGSDNMSGQVRTICPPHIHDVLTNTAAATSALTKHHAVSEREYHPQHGTTSKLYTP